MSKRLYSKMPPVTDFLCPRISEKEFQRRYKLVRDTMKNKNLDCLLVHVQGKEMYQQNVRWLSYSCSGFQMYVVLPLEGELTHFEQLGSHMPSSMINSPIDDMRPYSLDGVVQRLKELKMEEGKIGIVGTGSGRASSIPHDHYEYITGKLPKAEFSSATQWYEQLRMVKSEEEIKFVKKGAQISDISLEACIKATRPGVRDFEIFSALWYAGMRAGGQVSFALYGSTPMSNSIMPYPWPMYTWPIPSHRIIKLGDLIQNEISVAYGGYSGQIIQPVAVGPPTREFIDYFDMALDTYLAVQKAARPGATKDDIMKAASPLRESDLWPEGGAPLVHGWDNCPSAISYPLKENTLFMIEPNPQTRDRKRGIFFGRLNLITANGAKDLHNYPYEFTVV